MAVKLPVPFCHQAKSLKPEKEESSAYGLPFYHILESVFSQCSVVFMIGPGSEAVNAATNDLFSL